MDYYCFPELFTGSSTSSRRFSGARLCESDRSAGCPPGFSQRPCNAAYGRKASNRRLVQVNRRTEGAEANWRFSVFDWRVVAGHGLFHAAMHVDRLLGEHGIGQDSAAGPQEFERQMERRRLEAIDEEALKPLWRGWQESELATHRRSDPGKLAIAVRLRSETTLPIK